MVPQALKNDPPGSPNEYEEVWYFLINYFLSKPTASEIAKCLMATVLAFLRSKARKTFPNSPQPQHLNFLYLSFKSVFVMFGISSNGIMAASLALFFSSGRGLPTDLFGKNRFSFSFRAPIVASAALETSNAAMSVISGGSAVLKVYKEYP